jgi:hypothetical protein
MEKFDKKKFKKIFKKIFREFFFQIFLGYRCSAANLGYACKKFGGLGLLVWEEIETAQTVHKGLAKLLYRFADSFSQMDRKRVP